MKFSVLLALAATCEAVKISGDNGYFFARDIGRGTLDKKYERVPPARFSADSDDLFMRSVIMKYAAEEKTEDGAPSGNFFLNEASTRALASEVLGTHKGLSGDALKSYLDTYFAKAWAHFDVNKSGMVEVLKMPQFMRFVASDQSLSLGESG